MNFGIEISELTLKIFDVLENEIRPLVNEERPVGTHDITWDGKNDSGVNVSSGIYFLRFQFNQQFRNLKLMLLK